MKAFLLLNIVSTQGKDPLFTRLMYLLHIQVGTLMFLG